MHRSLRTADPLLFVRQKQNLTIRETRLIVDYLGLPEGCFDDED